MSTIKTRLVVYILIGVILIGGTWFCADAYYNGQTAAGMNHTLQSLPEVSYEELENRLEQATERIKGLNKKVEESMFEVEGLRSQNRRLGDDYTLLNDKYKNVLEINQSLTERLKKYE